jgi:hypothetical protein
MVVSPVEGLTSSVIVWLGVSVPNNRKAVRLISAGVGDSECVGIQEELLSIFCNVA